jgi:hypothetical protein
MTAIVAVHTPEGYILAADGRQMHGTSLDDETVKLFHSSAHNSTVAWGCYGAVGLPFSGLDSFDLAEVSVAASKQMEHRDYSSLEEYAMEMATAVYAVLSIYCLKHSAIMCFPEEVFPGLAFVGYVNGKAELAHVEIRHRCGQWFPPSAAPLFIRTSGLAIAAGSEAVYRALEKGEMLNPPKTLEEGAELARSYIQTCIENNETCDECEGIGGKIHIAAVTPDGFAWKIKPGCIED